MNTFQWKLRLRYLIPTVLSIVAMTVYIMFSATDDRYTGYSVRLLTGWTAETGAGPPSGAASASEPKTVRIAATLPALEPEDALIFRTENLPVTVTLEGQTLYQSPVYATHQTVGDHWLMIALPHDASYRQAQITGRLVFPAASKPVSVLYLGSRADFFRILFKQKGLGFLVSTLVFLLGAGFLASSLLFRTKAMALRLSVPFSLLCIALGLWSATQTEIPELLWGESPGLLFLVYGLISFAVAMVCFFLRSLPAPGWLTTLYLWIGVAELGLWVASILCEALRLAAYVETLPATQALAAVTLLLFVVQAPGLIRNFRTQFYMLLGFLCLAVMVAADLLRLRTGVYDYAGNTRFGLFWGMALIAVQFFRNARESMKLAEEAEVMRRLAYRDTLTGLRNRLALVHDQEALLAKGTPCIGIVQMDINGLKAVNDSQGHEAGDELILRATAAIRAAFADMGHCYRIGGDEFVALLTHNEAQINAQTCFKRLSRACAQQNRDGLNPLSVAMGFAVYRPDRGDRFYELVHAADMRMYEQKRRMKAKQATEANGRV